MHYANVFERLGRQVLAELVNLPEIALRWPLPLPQGDSLYTRTMHLFKESAYWVLQVIGGQDQLDDQGMEKRTGGTLADLAFRYDLWLNKLRQVLDRLPGANLGLTVDVPPPYQDLFDGKTTTIRACLLQAVEQCAVYVGQIQFICQLFADGDRVLIEVNELIQESMIVVGQPSDYSQCEGIVLIKEQENPCADLFM